VKRSVAWFGSLAVVLALGFTHYAVADAPANVTAQDLTVLHSATIAGPLLFSGGNYSGPHGHSGGPTGWWTINAGEKCTFVPLDTQYVDGEVLGHDYNDATAFVTLRGIYPGVYVAGAELFYTNLNNEVNRLKVCLVKKATTRVDFNYLVVNSGADG
jgi:hypothetical protein